MIYRILLAATAFAAINYASYRTGWERATAQHRVETVIATEKMKDSVRRAADALVGLSLNITGADSAGQHKLQEISDAAQNTADQCLVDADRLRLLDAIAN